MVSTNPKAFLLCSLPYSKAQPTNQQQVLKNVLQVSESRSLVLPVSVTFTSFFYRVRYTFEKDATSGNYKATIKINDVAFVTDKDLNVSTLDGFQMVCGGGGTDLSKVRYITVDNVIICGTPGRQ